LREFEGLYRRRFHEVYWTAYAILKDEGRAQDAVQIVFMRALAHCSMLMSMEERQQRLWLYKTVRNACIDELRRIRREPAPAQLEEGPDTAPLPEELLESREVQARVFGLVEELPELYRRPILLYYFAEMPQREIAQLLGVNENTLRSRLKRGKAILYNMLTEGGGLDG